MKAEHYVRNILEIFQMLTEEEMQYAYLEQDNATAHTSQQPREAFCEIFCGRIISWSLWPLCLQDLFVRVIFMCGGT